MSSRDKERLNPFIDRKLASMARSSPVPLPWHEVWSLLEPDSTEEERLKVCQAIRDSGDLPDDAGYFLVSWKMEYLTDAALGLLDPLQTLNLFESTRAVDRILGKLLERHGEGQMAAQFRSDPEEHARRREAGRQFFFGPDEPQVPEEPGWLAALLQTVADSIVANESVEMLHYWHRQSDDSSEVHIGRPATAGWAIDIERLRGAFDRVDSCGWLAVPPGANEAPYGWVAGRFLDREVFVRLPVDGHGDVVAGGKPEVWSRSQK